LAGQAIDAYQRTHPTGYVQNYSFDLQYELNKSTVVEVGYSGNQSRKLLYGSVRAANQLPTQLLSMGSALDQQVRNPFQGVITTGPLSGATVPANQLLRPFPQFSAVNLNVETPGASASFNALVAKITKQFSGGLMLVSGYQFSKAIDDASETQGWEIGDAFRDYYDQRVERSISGHDVPHSWVTSLVYELPVGKGRKFGSSLPAAANAVVGGWQISTTARFSSGLPLQVTTGNNLAVYGFGVQRPNIANLNSLDPGNRVPERWFNTNAFTAPANYTIGNAPRYFPNLRFDSARHADFALAKQFTFRERLTAKFCAEAINLTNTPQFGRANTVQTNAAFGSVTTTINRPRNIQLSLRLQF
jgi:hypothetical protein